MKSLSVKLGVSLFIIGLAIFGNIEVWGADWKLFSSTEYSSNFYDAESITFPAKKIIRVMVRVEITEKGAVDAVKALGKEYENFGYSMDLFEINCEERMQRSLALTNYSKNGSIIFASSGKGPTGWRLIHPGSISDGVYKALCK